MGFIQVTKSVFIFSIYTLSKRRYSFAGTFTVFYLCLLHIYINFVIKTGIQRSEGSKLNYPQYCRPDLDLIPSVCIRSNSSEVTLALNCCKASGWIFLTHEITVLVLCLVYRSAAY